jgi:hypothetical protein
MEKVIVTLRSETADDEWVDRLCGPVATALVELGVPGLTINVRDAPVRDSLMTLTTLDPPVQALVSVWVQQHYGEQMRRVMATLESEADLVAAYLVTESVPMAAASAELGRRAPGLANIALLRRPADMDESTWLTRWHRDHTPVAIATQSTFGYVQNYVVRALTEDAPALSAIVEELFPIEAAKSLHAFFGAADDAELHDRLGKMVVSTTAFGANVNIDTVPSGRYVFANPFAD